MCLCGFPCCCKGCFQELFLSGASLLELLRTSKSDASLPYLISWIEKRQGKKKKKKTDPLQLGKDEDKEEAGVQIKPPTARCPPKGPSFSKVTNATEGRCACSSPRPRPEEGERRGSPSHHLAVVVLGDCPVCVPVLLGPPVAPVLPLQPAPLPPLLPVPLVL